MRTDSSPDAAPASARWQFWIDRGGTFTDIVGWCRAGDLRTLKLLSEQPERYSDAAVEGIRRLLGLAPSEAITPARVECVKMGTTVATNALLERRGEPTLLLITRGLRDALRIATQARPQLFARRIVLPERLYSRVIEADERIDADGTLVRPLDLAALEHELRQAHADGLRACAIVFMHGWRHPAHEAAAAALARRIGYTQVSVSHEVSPLMKLVPRGDTTVVDAYLSPILRRYVEQVAAQMPGVPLQFMQSSGGLSPAERFQGKDALLSGPAGGIVGMARTGQAAGHTRLIGFDMGGTSTDVSHWAGALERVFDTEVAGVRVRAPMLAIHTVAAGGGSVIGFDGARLRVGPQSAGADPGPACYRRGGPLTVTDANVLLGRLQPAHFPALFGPQGDQPLDRAVVEQRFAALAAAVGTAHGRPVTAEDVAAGALQIAVGHMANAIKRISVARGHDVTGYTLQCFGGAGGQHACLVADALGMTQVLAHPLAGLLSAYGMGLADQSVLREASLERQLDAAGLAAARQLGATLAAQARAELEGQGVPDPDAGAAAASSAATPPIELHTRLQLRYHGTDTALPCTLGPDVVDDSATLAALRQDFEAAYRQRFAFLMPERALVIEAVHVEALRPGAALPAVPTQDAPPHQPAPLAELPLYCLADTAPAGWRPARLYQRERLGAGARIDGPAVIAERNATTVVEPGWQASLDAAGVLLLRRMQPRAAALALGTQVDPVLLEVFNNLYMNIAEQMGQRLQNTAASVNIKERLDFSCALFDAEGQLIANAPHMPVHLGSMSESIRSVIERNPQLRPGEVYALNDPYHGGTHLPDITVVTPVFLAEMAETAAAPAADAQRRPDFYVASRGHHADIGGITPGSMPPFSTSIAEEGILIDNFLLVEVGPQGPRLREAELLALLGSGPWPARNPAQNLADLRAQIAANEKGVQELRALVAQVGHATVAAYMQHVQDHAEAAVRRVIGTLRDGRWSLTLDNGARIEVELRVKPDRRSAVIDFSGSSAQLAHNFNAPRAITLAAVLYVLRTLVDDAIPLNAGCLKPIELIVPPGSMLDPQPPAAVVAGNVETSSCITNALYGALGLMAAAQCTMNNFTFGDATHQYYETIAGGSGAGLRLDAAGRIENGFDGCSAVQTHMTNSRLTDPEVLEWRFPVRVEQHALRPGSGGAGRWRGGDGAERRIRFLAPMTASILANGRRHGAFGLQGGAAGAAGCNWVERADGRIEPLDHLGQVQMQAGDVFVIQTPGGGGCGVAEPPTA